MRIDAYNQVYQTYNTQITGKMTNAQGKKGASAYDQFEMSQVARDYQVAKQAVAGVADVREDLVAQMKERLAKGTYEVNIDDFADKLISKMEAII